MKVTSRWYMRWLGLGLLALAGVASRQAVAAPRPPEFNRDIRPLLSDNCFFCHGPDRRKRKAGLRLDDREVAITKAAIIPGKPDDSEMIKRLISKDPDDVMPPPDAHKSLTAAQIDTLRRWIAAGAVYQPHWAYVPIKRPLIPSVKNPNWGRNPIDAFILHELEERNLTPAPPADPATLLRRLALDLTGLPPSPEDLRHFVATTSPVGWTRQVDRLLASPHYGERMAVPWLDVVRFADTVGYHGDQNANVAPYRDWVIDAYNRNKPFDRFTIEQLAGDLLPHPTPEQLVATGFNRLNMVTREGGAQANEYLAKYMADRVRTVGQAWLGSTTGCAECHDHKFDPITAKDFYSLGAFFADIKEWGVYADYEYTPNPDLKGWGNDHPFPPEILVASPYQTDRLRRLQTAHREALQNLSAKPDRGASQTMSQWQSGLRGFLRRNPNGFQTILAADVKVDEATVAQKADGTVVIPPADKDVTAVVAVVSPGTHVASLCLDLPPREGIRFRTGKTAGFVSVSAQLRRAGEKPVAVKFDFGDATSKQLRYSNGFENRGIHPGNWGLVPPPAGGAVAAVWELKDPIDLGPGDSLEISIKSDSLGAYRVAMSPLAGFSVLPSPWWTETSRQPLLLNRLRDQRTAQSVYGMSGHAPAEARHKVQALAQEIRNMGDGREASVVTVTVPPRPVRVLPRGNWQDETGEKVEPATFHFLPAPPNPERRRLTRLDLAQWLTSRDNPLTARAVMNRLWKQFFGSGLSNQLTDLGAQGELPSHPELLDWLAAEFMESGWDQKHMVRLLVESSTYRQDSTIRPELKESDPNNRLLARQSQRRLDAEFVRDNALAIAGLITLDIGGPSMHPYQPAGYFENLEFPRRDYVAETDDRQYRRGLYAHRQRTFLHPMLANFDAPSREECTADRSQSNTPQQALTLLNDPVFVEAARAFADSVLANPRLSDEERLDLAFERAEGRRTHADELMTLKTLLADQRAHFAAHADDAVRLLEVGQHPAAVRPGDPGERAAWTSLCRVILNLYGTITRL